jgi:NAD(P)-dependent dehydrogenase (short-subunit alcohol dehydrogenase family)
MPGLSAPSEIAAAIAYLASDDARSITGASLVIDRGALL